MLIKIGKFVLGISFFLETMIIICPAKVWAQDSRTSDEAIARFSDRESSFGMETVTLNLKVSSEVSGSTAYLGDIATCIGPDKLCEEVYGIDLGIPSESNAPVTLSAEKIKTLLKREWPLVEVSMAGAKSTALTFLSEAPSEDDIRAVITKRLLPITDAGNYKIEIEKIQFPPTSRLPRGYHHVDIIGFSSEDFRDERWIMQHFQGRQKLKIAAYDDSSEDPIKTIDILVNFVLKKKTLVARRDLAKGTIIQPEDLDEGLATVSTAAIKDKAFFTSMETLRSLVAGRRLREDLKVSEAILLKNTENTPVIKRNQLINLLMNHGDLSVGLKGKSLDNGGIGDTIDVIYATTKKRLKARVINSDSAEVVE